jgi:hypothetical protein
VPVKETVTAINMLRFFMSGLLIRGWLMIIGQSPD